MREPQTVPVGDADLEVRVQGTGDPLLLIQTALDPEALVPLAGQPGISDRYRTIDLRRRGYGASTPVTGPGSIPREAGDSLAVLGLLDATPAHVVGTSYSGAVALELAASAPSAVRTLTLMEPPPTDVAAGDEFRAANAQLVRTFAEQGVTQALEAFSRMLGAPSWLVERAIADADLVARVERDATTFFTSDVPALLTWRFDAARARRVTAPVLYAGGADSGPWFAQVHDWVRELFPASEHHVIPGAGHSLAGSHASEVAGLLTDFLDRHP